MNIINYHTAGGYCRGVYLIYQIKRCFLSNLRSHFSWAHARDLAYVEVHFRGALLGTTHFRGHFQGPRISGVTSRDYGFTFRKHTYRGPSFSGPHAQGFSSRNHVHYRGSHSLHWSILTFFIGDISAISLV